MTPPPGPSWPDVMAGYWRHMGRVQAALPNTNDNLRDFWAREAVDSLFAVGIPEAIDKFVQFADTVPDPELLGYLGGGPLEDLVQFWGDENEDEILTAAKRSSNFAAALRIVDPTQSALVLWGAPRRGISRRCRASCYRPVLRNVHLTATVGRWIPSAGGRLFDHRGSLQGDAPLRERVLGTRGEGRKGAAVVPDLR